jgi:hypothetical protein
MDRWRPTRSKIDKVRSISSALWADDDAVSRGELAGLRGSD